MRRAVVGVVIALAACGGDGGGSGDEAPALDCSVMLGNGSCWVEILESMDGCLPGQDIAGLLSADRTSCTYDAGAEITFSGPLPVDPFGGEDFDWSFRMTVAGRACVDWKEGLENGWVVQQITTRAGLARFESRSEEASLTCPDGTRYVSRDPSTLLGCAPSRPLTGSPDAITLSLGISGLRASEVKVFTCSP